MFTSGSGDVIGKKKFMDHRRTMEDERRPITIAHLVPSAQLS